MTNQVAQAPTADAIDIKESNLQEPEAPTAGPPNESSGSNQPTDPPSGHIAAQPGDASGVAGQTEAPKTEAEQVLASSPQKSTSRLDPAIAALTGQKEDQPFELEADEEEAANS